MSAIDEAVRRFNETAAQTPLHMFAPGNFWDKQSAALALQRHQAGQDASQWINQQLGQRMPGGVPRSQEGRRLDMSADPRYGAQFPAAAPAPQVDQALVDRANELFGKVGDPKDVEGTDRVLYADELGRIPGVNEEKLTPAARAALRDRAIRSRLANDPDWVAWREAARAAGADATAKGLPSPDLQAPLIQGQIFQRELTPEQQAAKEMFDAARKERGEQRKQAILEAAQRRRAQAAISSLRDPQTRNAVLAAGLFGGQMPQNAAIALQLMGYPDAAKLFADNQRTQQELDFRAQEGDKNRRTQLEIALLGAQPDPIRWAATYTQIRNSVVEEIKAERPNATPEELDRLVQRRLEQRLQQSGVSPPGAASGQPPAPTPATTPAPSEPAPTAPQTSPQVDDLAARLRGANKAETLSKSFPYDPSGLKNVREVMSQKPEVAVQTMDALFEVPEDAARALYDPDQVQGLVDGLATAVGSVYGSEFSKQRRERQLHALNYILLKSGMPPAKDLESAQKTIHEKLWKTGKMPPDLRDYWMDYGYSYRPDVVRADRFGPGGSG